MSLTELPRGACVVAWIGETFWLYTLPGYAVDDIRRGFIDHDTKEGIEITETGDALARAGCYAIRLASRKAQGGNR